MFPVIELKDISKTFTERTWRSMIPGRKPKTIEALKNISLKINKGEIFGLLGPNGAGKTTLIKILATLIIPESGSGNILGKNIVKDSNNIRCFIGLVNSSERSFYWRLTGRQNLYFFASLYNLNLANRDKYINEIIKLVGLSEKADIKFMKYSEGQKQRLAIARALLHDPEIILMDEATKSLDPIGAYEIREFVKNELSRNKGKTIIWCTHNLNEADTVCDRIAIIHKGRIIKEGNFKSLHDIFEKNKSFYLKIKSCTVEKLAELGIIPSNIICNNGFLEFEINAPEYDIPDYINRLTSNSIQVYKCVSKEYELEEIFEHIIKTDATDSSKTHFIH